MAQARQSSSPRTQHSTKAVQSHVANTSSCSSNSMRQAMFKQQAPQQLSKNHYNGNNNSTSSPQSPACTSPLDSRFLYSPTTATTITVKRAFTMVQPDESGKPPTAIASSMNTATGKSSTTSGGHNIGEPANCACCTSSSSSNHNHNTLTVNSSITRTTHQEEDVFSSYLNNQKDTTSFIYFEGEEEEESEGTSSYNEDDSEYTEDEDEEDQEEDENAHQLPFWFGVEEACHISEVIKRYSTFLKLNEKRGANSRLPVRFVGKVQRSVMSLIFNEDREVESMKTFDEVHIYEKSSSLMYGAVHPKVSEILLETEYDWQGIPTKFVKKKTSEKPDDLDERYCSWLFCYPIYASDKFGYESVLGDEDIDHRKDIGYCDLYNKCLQRLSISKAKECIGSPEQSQFCYSPSINDDTNSDEEENENSDNDDLDHLPSYMKDLIPHLSGSGPLEVDRCFGYFDDDK
ncbi:hypothetical protein C9374_009545 [Naegleria lovaniensis]|uniref:Uncharacterized protein n=1 Tax=Naegleria lovaniensis TaxID=51637 RepID=A0AA88H1J1_NAELO|nr:uncharacterized protein C9374_009545 [Naegleria lovaniensis]KAG2392968.1 hypothetical protein C9374_009545 [Naegleria lovaniensis]